MPVSKNIYLLHANNYEFELHNKLHTRLSSIFLTRQTIKLNVL